MMGLTESNIDHGKRIAEIGYTVLVADLYDRGFSLASDEAFAMMTELKDTPEEINRLNIVLDILAGDKHVIREKVGVVGFCYGGHCALKLARIGAEIKT
ncbi:dienelactone hydrolase family protein, partial [Klebsiella pneumoniae]|nr:dienelactone hydrolase family protein [Klebsiella pneumoniae]